MLFGFPAPFGAQPGQGAPFKGAGAPFKGGPKGFVPGAFAAPPTAAVPGAFASPPVAAVSPFGPVPGFPAPYQPELCGIQPCCGLEIKEPVCIPCPLPGTVAPENVQEISEEACPPGSVIVQARNIPRSAFVGCLRRCGIHD